MVSGFKKSTDWPESYEAGKLEGLKVQKLAGFLASQPSGFPAFKPTCYALLPQPLRLLQLLFQYFIYELWIGLAAGCAHDLSDKEAQQFGLALFIGGDFRAAF